MQLLLADDHGMFRDSMAVWLRQLDGDVEVEFAATYEEVQQYVDAGGACDLLLDLGMPGMQGVYSVRQICTRISPTPVLIVSANSSPLIVRGCIEAGVRGYVTKHSDGQAMLQAVKIVLAGGEYIPITARSQTGDQHELNEKQMQLLALLAEGHSNKAIAEIMHLSEGTVKQYVTKMLRRLNVDNRVQAGLKARELLGIKPSH